MKEDQIAETWSAFVRQSVGELTNKQVADRIGVSDTTIGNWLRGANLTQPDANKVLAFAREFGRPVPLALAAAGFIEEREFRETVVVNVRHDVAKMSTDEMVDAMVLMLGKIRDREHPVRKKERRSSE